MSTAILLLTLGALPILPQGWGEWDALDEVDPRGPVGSSSEDPEPPALVPPARAPEVPAAKPALPTPKPATPIAVPAAVETTVFRVGYGMLGELGEVKISFGFPGGAIQATGSGSGSLFGLGKIEKRVESELEPAALSAKRWVSTRVQSGKVITDTVEQASPGDVAVVRRRSDRPEEGHRFTRESPVLDPLTFLYRLRSQPPRVPTTFEVLDGRALWLITMQPTRTATASPTRKVLIVDGRAEPIFWDGKPDDDRSARAFTLYLEGDAQHTPLRLVMPLAVGEVRVELTTVIHQKAAPTPKTTATAALGPGDEPRAVLVKNLGR